MLSLILPNGGGGGGSSAWGGITGTLSAQTDLQTALDAKLAKSGGTMTGQLINSANGAASTPSLLLSGAPFTGGSATTTKPLALIETAGATSTGWNTGGTMLGVNAPSGFGGRLFDFQRDGISHLSLVATGSSTATLHIGASEFMRTNFGGAGRMLIGGAVGGLFFQPDSYAAFGAGTALAWTPTSTGPGNIDPDAGFTRGGVGVMKVTLGYHASGYGTLDAAGFKVAGVAGASFGPGAVTSITVVNGIITAIS